MLDVFYLIYWYIFSLKRIGFVFWQNLCYDFGGFSCSTIVLMVSDHPFCFHHNILANFISNLPWSWMTLMASDNLSIILLTMAWFSLTSNILCYAIPVLRILVPMIMTKAERIPDSIKANVDEFNSLSLGVVQYCLIAGVTVVSESE